MAPYKNAETDRCLLVTRKTEKSDGLPALQIQSSHTPSSKCASAVHFTGRTSRFAMSNKLILLEQEAKNLLQQLSLVSAGKIVIGSVLGCVPATNDGLR